MYIPIILGTAREGRQSEKVAYYIEDKVKEAGITTKILDVRDFRTEATTTEGAIVKRYKNEITKAEALIIVSPEYNHAYPGELKMMLDMAYNEYSGKPVGICGVSAGGLGGARVVEQLRLVLAAFGMIQIKESLYFSNVESLFDTKGTIQDASYDERVVKFLKQLKEGVK